MPSSFRRSLPLAAALALSAAPAFASYVLFESGQVRPLAMSPDGTKLFAANSPDNHLEIFQVGAGGLTKTGSVEVGMEPVAVAARSNTEVWVVNHLSDSISIVDVSVSPPRVTRTLLVGDEPRDIVFAGPGGNRAFITTARRGQNVPGSVPPLLTTEGTPRALVFVFDATNLGNTLEGTPLTIIELFGDTPRALAVSPDGSTVYAAIFQSGNQTTTVSEGAVCNDSNLNNNTPQGPCNVFGVTMPGGLPNPERNALPDNAPRPETGLIVKFNQGANQWRDQLNRNWNNAVRFDLPDFDVFKINANANPPVQIGIDDLQYAHVGTVLFDMVANPMSGKVYVSNTEAINEVRFEGPGIIGGSSVRGHLHEARISILDNTSSAVTPRHLNKHINYSQSQVPSPMGTADASLATPVGLAVNSTGTQLFVAAFGSQKIGVFDTTKLENDTFTTVTPGRRPARQPGRRRSHRPGARRGAQPPLRPHPLRQLGARGQHHLPQRRDRAAAGAVQPRVAEHHRRPAVPLRRPFDLQQRRGVVLELPRLRRLRQPRLGPRQPGRPDPQQRQPDPRPRPRSRLPPDEGPHDDAEPARHGQPRPDALARRPHRRPRRAQRPTRRRRLRRGSRLSRSSTSPSPACSAAAPS